jgi:hypothetical protein
LFVQNRRRPLAILLLFAVMHGSAAVPHAAAPDVVPPADMGMSHQGHDHPGAPDAGGHPAGHAGPDCCESAACECGCVAPPATAIRAAATVGDRARIAEPRADAATGHAPGTTGAPFRPPA